MILTGGESLGVAAVATFEYFAAPLAVLASAEFHLEAQRSERHHAATPYGAILNSAPSDTMLRHRTAPWYAEIGRTIGRGTTTKTGRLCA